MKLKIRAIILWIKGDWSEYCGTYALPTWRSILRPCLFCSSPALELYDVDNISVANFPHHLNENEDYFVACDRAEIKITVTKRIHDILRVRVRFDKRPGYCGLCVTQDIDELQLRSGDRIEPSDSLPDVGLFDGLTIFPIVITLWRVAN
jgi:hypothetical protein